VCTIVGLFLAPRRWSRLFVTSSLVLARRFKTKSDVINERHTYFESSTKKDVQGGKEKCIILALLNAYMCGFCIVVIDADADDEFNNKKVKKTLSNCRLPSCSVWVLAQSKTICIRCVVFRPSSMKHYYHILNFSSDLLDLLNLPIAKLYRKKCAYAFMHIYLPQHELINIC